MEQIPVEPPSVTPVVDVAVQPRKKNFQFLFTLLLLAVLVSAGISVYVLLGYKKALTTMPETTTNPFASETAINPFTDTGVTAQSQSINPFASPADDNPFSNFDTSTQSGSSSYQNPF